MYSGGLIGVDSEISLENSVNFENTPVYLGCDEHDFHIPASRVTDTAEIFKKYGADVTLSLYTNLGHRIHKEGLSFLQRLL